MTFQCKVIPKVRPAMGAFIACDEAPLRASTAIVRPETTPSGAVSGRIKGSPRSEFPGYAPKESAPRTELGCKDADARAAADLIDLVRQVDDIEAHREGPGSPNIKCVAQAEVDLGVARRVVAIRNGGAVGERQIIAQSRSHQRIDTHPSA